MARYRKIDPRIWNDEKFRELSDNGKLVFFFVLTHPHMTALGAFRGTIAGLAEELSWNLEVFREAFREVCAKGMIEHDPKPCLIVLPNFLKYNQPESPNVVKAWAAALDLLPECELKSVVIQRAKAFTEGMTEAFAKAFPEALPKAMPNQEQEQEQEHEQEKGAPPAVSPVTLRHDLLDGLKTVKKYAASLLQELVLTQSRQYLEAAEAAIKLEIGQGKTADSAYEFILARAIADRARTTIDIFYLNDWGKHRNGPQEQRSSIDQQGADWLKRREERGNTGTPVVKAEQVRSMR